MIDKIVEIRIVNFEKKIEVNVDTDHHSKSIERPPHSYIQKS